MGALTDKQKQKLERRNVDQYDAFNKKIDALGKDVRSNTRALRGTNSSPGVIGEIKTMHGDVTAMRKDVATIRTLLFGVEDDADDTGIKGRLLNITTMFRQSKRLFWAALIAFVTGFGKLFFDWIVKGMQYVNNLPPPTGTPMP